MLQVQFLREEKETVLNGLKKKNFKELSLVDDAISTDDARKAIQFQLDENLAKMNALSKEIGSLMQAGKKEEAEAAKLATSEYKTEIENLKSELKNT
jgi:seryl-tRNA synthetase